MAFLPITRLRLTCSSAVLPPMPFAPSNHADATTVVVEIVRSNRRPLAIAVVARSFAFILRKSCLTLRSSGTLAMLAPRCLTMALDASISSPHLPRNSARPRQSRAPVLRPLLPTRRSNPSLQQCRPSRRPAPAGVQQSASSPAAGSAGRCRSVHPIRPSSRALRRLNPAVEPTAKAALLSSVPPLRCGNHATASRAASSSAYRSSRPFTPPLIRRVMRSKSPGSAHLLSRRESQYQPADSDA